MMLRLTMYCCTLHIFERNTYEIYIEDSTNETAQNVHVEPMEDNFKRKSKCEINVLLMRHHRRQRNVVV